MMARRFAILLLLLVTGRASSAPTVAMMSPVVAMTSPVVAMASPVVGAELAPPATAQGRASSAPTRIVCLIPAVTEMIYAMGDGGRLVAVSAYDHFPADVARLPRVGGLLDPSVERILALKPHLVILYATQKELIERLDRAKIPYFNYQHKALPDILTTIRSVGARIGSAARADAVAAEMERSLAEIRSKTAGLPHPATLLVFERDPASLRNVYASGGYGFLHDMLEIAGGGNVFAQVKQQAVQASTEMLIASKPDVIIELLYGDSLKNADVARELRAWDALASVPAVRSHRIFALTGDEFVVPGPRVVDATRKLARALHPDAFK
jgi:iron complex transport system substrate-binding protein